MTTGWESATGARELGMISDLVLGIDHVALAVPELEASLAFYREALGFQLLERRVTGGENTSMESAVLVSKQATIVIAQGRDPESQTSRFVQERGPGVSHVALRVSNLDEAVRRLQARGVALDSSIVEGQQLRQVFLRRDAASGVRIELIERSAEGFGDTSVAELYAEFERKRLY